MPVCSNINPRKTAPGRPGQAIVLSTQLYYQTIETMELQEFIRTALVQLVKGVESAQNDLKTSKAAINPLGTKAQIALEQNRETPSFTNVEFEVAVEVKNSGEQSGGVGIQIAVFKMGIDGKKAESESHMSRLRFTVPVHLPPGKFFGKDN